MIEKKERNLKQEANGCEKHRQFLIDISELEMGSIAFHVIILFEDKFTEDIFILPQQDLTFDLTNIIAIHNASRVINIRAEILVNTGMGCYKRLGEIN